MILGTGIDIIEVNRIKKAIGRWGHHFLKHVFTEEEIQYAEKHKNPYQHYAARFAAKEAIYKAISNDPHLGWKDITILNNKDGKPYCLINKEKFNKTVSISISHSDNYAVAHAIISS